MTRRGASQRREEECLARTRRKLSRHDVKEGASSNDKGKLVTTTTRRAPRDDEKGNLSSDVKEKPLQRYEEEDLVMLREEPRFDERKEKSLQSREGENLAMTRKGGLARATKRSRRHPQLRHCERSEAISGLNFNSKFVSERRLNFI